MTSYFFPGPIDRVKPPHSKREFKHTANSGENAIRLLLRSFKLSPKAKIALPLFVCDSLKTAVTKENLELVCLDIKANSYWTNYDDDILKKSKVQAVILVHLYGFIHPDTNRVIGFCRNNNIPLIHDATQCYGVDESVLNYGSIVYSFGPGKSTTAACGGTISVIEEQFYYSQVEKPTIWADIKARLFMRSRIYGYSLSFIESIVQRILAHIDTRTTITTMTGFQKKAAAYVMDNLNSINTKRKERYSILAQIVNENPELSIAYDDANGLYLKCIINVKGDITRFKEYLTNSNVPFYSLFDDIALGLDNTADKPYFILNAKRFIEISTEATIPLTEIKRVGEVLLNFN